MSCAGESGPEREGQIAGPGFAGIDFLGRSNSTGLRLVVASFAILCGVTGVMAGIFEIGQGDVEIEGFVIATIDSEHALAGELTYFAVTVIPNMLITGIAAIAISVIVMVWAVFFVQRSHGPLILFGLLIAQTLLGGGWILDMAIITFILATRIGKPMGWWRRRLTGRVRALFDRLLIPSVICYAVICFGLIALTIMMVDDPSWWDPLNLLATIMFVPMVLMMVGAVAHDIEVRPSADQ